MGLCTHSFMQCETNRLLKDTHAAPPVWAVSLPPIKKRKGNNGSIFHEALEVEDETGTTDTYGTKGTADVVVSVAPSPSPARDCDDSVTSATTTTTTTSIDTMLPSEIQKKPNVTEARLKNLEAHVLHLERIVFQAENRAILAERRSDRLEGMLEKLFDRRVDDDNNNNGGTITRTGGNGSKRVVLLNHADGGSSSNADDGDNDVEVSVVGGKAVDNHDGNGDTKKGKAIIANVAIPLGSSSDRDRKTISTKNWNANFQELRAYRIKYGDCNAKKKGEHTKLGNWVRTQRKARSAAHFGRMSSVTATITPDKIALLDSIGFWWGVRFSKMPPSWEVSYKQLMKQRYSSTENNRGKCCNCGCDTIVTVTNNSCEISDEVPSESGVGVPLDKWISYQQEEYKIWKKDREQSLLTDEQVEKLKKIKLLSTTPLGFNVPKPQQQATPISPVTSTSHSDPRPNHQSDVVYPQYTMQVPGSIPGVDRTYVDLELRELII